MFPSPQQGFQTEFLNCQADVAIGGGAAGVGKTFTLLYAPTPNLIRKKSYTAIIFRKELEQIKKAGALWDKSCEFFGFLPASIRPLSVAGNSYTHKFNNGSKMSFGYLSHHSDHLKHQGPEYAYIGFDELTHFLEKHFWYLTSRNRSMHTKYPFVRATTNPVGSGWIKDLVSWYLYPTDYYDQDLADYPIPERSGVLRYYMRFDDNMIWGDSRAEVLDKYPIREGLNENLVKTFSFIAGRIDDNVILMEQNPEYKATLMALPENERIKLLGGRWRDTDKNNTFFERASVVDMFTNSFVEGGRRFMTVDIAFEGGDDAVLVVWSGWRIEHIMIINKIKGDTLVNLIRQKMSDWRVSERDMCFDSVGAGDYLNGYFRNSYAFKSSRAAIKNTLLSDSYENLRAQCAYYLRGKVHDSDVFIADSSVKQRVLDEFMAFKNIGADSKERQRFESKAIAKTRNHNKSTDILDAMIMRAVFDLEGLDRMKQGYSFLQ